MSGPGFDLPPSLTREEEFAASEADYSVSPSPDVSIPDEETPPGASPAAEAEELETKEPATNVEPIVPSPAVADGNVAPETPAFAPSVSEPLRPRRSGWWQRARASVIGK